METMRIKKWELAMLLALCITLCCGVWADARSKQLSSGLIRLHVIADSDSDVEQQVKLAVRDRVIDMLGPRLDGVQNISEARSVLESSMDDIKSAAEEIAGERSINVTLGLENYPTRQYDGFSLPAGEYTSLRVIIGSGEGHNWWCVVFPPLCTDASQLVSGDISCLSNDDIALITESDGGYVIKFRILELWGRLVEKLK